MAAINVYLNFNGNCREAFDFYRKVFGREYSILMTFKDMPLQEGMPPFPDDDKDLIMHVSLPISRETVLMGSDNSEVFRPPVKVGDNFSISVMVDSREEADHYFKALSEGGRTDMPMTEMFWGSYFGTLEDKFGINWMVDFQLEN